MPVLPALRRPVRRFRPLRPYGAEAWFLPTALCPHVGPAWRLEARRLARRPRPVLRLPRSAESFVSLGAAAGGFRTRLVLRVDCGPSLVCDSPFAARRLR